MESFSMPSSSYFRKKSYPRGLSHRVPLILPGLLALLGCTYPRAMLGFAACAGFLVPSVVWMLRSTRSIDRASESMHRGLLDSSAVIAVVVVSSVCLFAGIARGYFWERSIRAVEDLAGIEHSVEVTVVPLDYAQFPKYGPMGSFRALAWSHEAPEAGWFGVQAAAFPRDSPEFVPGVPARCMAVFEMPSRAMNPGGFDYREYLLSDRVLSLADIQSVASSGDSTSMAGKSPFPMLGAAIRLSLAAKAYMERALDSTFPKEDSAVLKGVFLGDRGSLAPEDSQDFKRSGFYRFIAICGFHVDLLLSLVDGLLRRLTKRPSLARIAAILVALCYASLSGWSAGVIRAFVSGSMRILAPPLRRKYHPLAGLGASAIVVAWFTPHPLGNTGFALSFAGAGGAWLGGIYAEVVSGMGMPADWGAISRVRVARATVSLLRAVTMSLVLLPILALSFTEVSIASFVLSGIWGTITALMVPLTGLVAFLPFTGALFGWAPYMLLQGVRAVSRSLSTLPFAGMVIPAPGTVEIAAYWALLLVPLTSGAVLGAGRSGEDAFTFFHRQRFLATLRRCVLVLSTAVLISTAAARAAALWPQVTFLYVGQGDCAIIRRGTSVMMVDTGTAAAFDSHVLPYLRNKGITDVDLCVISHLHADHVGGLPSLCAEVPVGCVAVTPGFSEQTQALLAADGLLPAHLMPPVVELKPGNRYEWAGAPIDVILPESGRYSTGEPTNESSLVFVIDLGVFEVEFWGDSPSSSVSRAFQIHPGLESIASPTVVKVPHHGSVDGYDPLLYERDGSSFLMGSVISVGPNSYGHPSNRVEEAAEEGGALFRTDEAGAVTFGCPFGKMVVSTFLPVPCRRTCLTGRSLFSSH